MNTHSAPDTEGLLNEDQAAALLGLSPRTLQGWRSEGTGPAWIYTGAKAVRYDPRTLKAWAVAGRAKTARGRKAAPVTLACKPVLAPRLVELLADAIARARAAGNPGVPGISATVARRLDQALQPHEPALALALTRRGQILPNGSITLEVERHFEFQYVHLDPHQSAVKVEYDPRSGRWESDIAASWQPGFPRLCAHVWRIQTPSPRNRDGQGATLHSESAQSSLRRRKDPRLDMAEHHLLALLGEATLAFLAEGGKL